MSTFHARICWLQEYESFESEKQKKRKCRGNLRKCSGFPCTCRGRVCHCAPAPPVQTLICSFFWTSKQTWICLSATPTFQTRPIPKPRSTHPLQSPRTLGFLIRNWLKKGNSRKFHVTGWGWNPWKFTSFENYPICMQISVAQNIEYLYLAQVT